VAPFCHFIMYGVRRSLGHLLTLVEGERIIFSKVFKLLSSEQSVGSRTSIEAFFPRDGQQWRRQKRCRNSHFALSPARSFRMG